MPDQTTFQDVRDFHLAFKHPVRDKPDATASAVPVELRDLRIELIREEFEELCEAALGRTVYVIVAPQPSVSEFRPGNVVGIADALADLVYVINGAALCYGIDLDEVFEEVHRSNMAKLGPDGKPIYREDGKVLKPEGWEPPDIAGVLGVNK